MATSNPGTAIRPSEASIAAGAEYYRSIGGVHPNYQVVLDVEGDPALAKDSAFPIVSNLPERYHIEFSASWSSPFSKNYLGDAADAIGGPMAGAALDIASKATGISTKLKSQSVQVWEQSSPLAFSIDLIFVAKTNTIKDVRDKHRALLKLAAPSEMGEGKGQVLVQPGPVIVNTSIGANTRKISMSIGNYLYLDNVVVNSVSSDVSTLCDEQGIPMHMVINVGVSSFYACFTTQDIDRAFRVAIG